MMRGLPGKLHAQVSDFFGSLSEPLPVKRTDQYWLRLPATGLCFLVFGLFTFILGIGVLPFIRLLSLGRIRGRRLARFVVAGGLRFFVEFLRGVGVMGYEFVGRDKLGRPGQLIVANHPTLIDAVFVMGFAPGTGCIVKAGHFRNLITRGAAKAAGYIPNAPTDEMIYSAEAALRAGETLLMFPEGTRTVPGKPVQMQRGAANVALRGARVLTPVFISCDPPTLSKNLPWYRIPPRRPKITLRVGQDIDLEAYRGIPVPIASRRLNADLAGLFDEAITVRN
jgi:1-acyl-sn-glycerol-3-phosphate acyltransferase